MMMNTSILNNTKEDNINCQIIDTLSKKYKISKEYAKILMTSTKDNPIVDCNKTLKLFKQVIEHRYNIEDYAIILGTDMPIQTRSANGNILDITYLYNNTIIEGKTKFTVADNKCDFPVNKEYTTIEECKQEFNKFKNTASVSLKYKYKYINSVSIYCLYNNKSDYSVEPDFRITKIKYYLIKEINRCTGEEKFIACTKDSLIATTLKVRCTLAYNNKYYLTARTRKISSSGLFKLKIVLKRIPKYNTYSQLLNASTIYDIEKIKEIYPQFFYFKNKSKESKSGKYKELVPCNNDSTVVVKGQVYDIKVPRISSTANLSMCNGFREEDMKKAIKRIKSTAVYCSSTRYKLIGEVIVPCLNIYKCAGYITVQQNIKRLYLVEEYPDGLLIQNSARYLAMSDIVLTDYALKYKHTNIELNFHTRPCSFSKNLQTIGITPKILPEIK